MTSLGALGSGMGQMIACSQGQQHNPPGLEPTGVQCTGSPAGDALPGGPKLLLTLNPHSLRQNCKAPRQGEAWCPPELVQLLRCCRLIPMQPSGTTTASPPKLPVQLPSARAWPQLPASSAPALGPKCFLQHSD